MSSVWTAALLSALISSPNAGCTKAPAGAGEGSGGSGNGTASGGAPVAGTGGTGSGGRSGSDGAATGGSATGGAATGGSATGGAETGGRTAGSGGTGAMSSTGGSSGGTTGTGGAGSGGKAGGGTLALSGLTLTANPNNTLSCFVSWSTADAADSEVDFGAGSYQFRIRDAAMVTAHNVLVIGMHAAQAYKIKAISANAQGTGSIEGMFTTGKLPDSVPVPMLTANDLADMQDGWTLTNVMPAKSGPAIIVMYDQGGLPVWYFIHGTTTDSRGDVSADLLPGNTITVGPTSGEPAKEIDLSGKVLWTGPSYTNQMLMSHFVAKTAAGNYLLNIELDKAVTSGSQKIDDQLIEEITPDLKVVWSWKLFDHIKVAGTREEVCHGNFMQVDQPGGFVYYNCRYLGLFKIDRASGDILWRLGGTYDKTTEGPGDFAYMPAAGQFSDAHDPELHDDGTILMYDNGGFSGLGSPGGGMTTTYHSRVVEYQVDQTAKTATLTWEFPGTFDVDAWYKNTWYSPYWGDADRLPNGNILITAGLKSASGSTRIFEVSRAGKVVWEITLPVNNGSFRAQRLSPPPLVEPIE